MAPRRRRRRALRILLRVLELSFLAVVLLVTSALLALHTDWGREQLRRQLEKQLNGLVDGQVTVGKITGSPLSKLQVGGLRVKDRDGKEAIAVGSFEMEWDPFALLGKTFHARSVTIVGPVATGTRLPDGSLSLVHLLKPAQPKPTEETGSSSWKVLIDRLIVRDGLMVLPLGDDVMSLAAVQIDGRLRIGGDRRDVNLTRLSGSWLEKGLPVVVSGTLISTTDMVALAGVVIDVGGTRAHIPLGAIVPGEGSLALTVDATAGAGELIRFWSGAGLLGDTTISGLVARAGGPEQPYLVRLHAAGAHGKIWAALSLDAAGSAVRGEVHASQIDLRAPVALRGDADLTLDVSGRTLPELAGTATLSLRGFAAGRRVDRALVHATVAGGRAQGDLALAVDGTRATVAGAVRFSPEVSIESARLRAQVPRLAALYPGARGAAAIDATLSGTPRDLSARGNLRAEKVAYGTTRAGTAAARFDVHGLPAAPRGQATVDATGVAFGASSVGPVHLEVQSRGARAADVKLSAGAAGSDYSGKVTAGVSRERRATRIEIGALDARTRGIDWKGSGGRVVLRDGGAIGVEDLTLTSSAARVEVSGELGAARGTPALDAACDLHIRLADVDLEKLRAAFAPGAAPLAGRLGADVYLVRHGRSLGVHAKVSGRGVQAGAKVPPIDGSLRVDLDGGKLVASGEAHQKAGAVKWNVDAAVPPNILDGRAWRGFDLDDALRGAVIELEHLDVGALAQLEQRPGYSGRIDGKITVRPGARAAELALTGRGLGAPWVKNVDVDLTGTWDHQALALDAKLGLAGQPVATVRGKLGVGLHGLVDTGAGGLGDPAVEAHVEARDLPLSSLASVMTMPQGTSGKLTFTADAAGRLSAPTAEASLNLDGAKVGGVDFQKLDARVKYGPAGIDASATARQQAGGTLDLDAHLEGKSAWAATARLRASAFDLAFLSAAAAGPTPSLAGTGGRLDADITFASGAERLAANGEVKITEGKFYIPSNGPVDHVELSAHLDAGRLVIDELSGRDAGGTITANGEGQLEGFMPRSFTLKASLRDFPVRAGTTVVKVTTQAEIAGKPRGEGAEAAGADLDLTATLVDTTVKVPKQRQRGQLQSTAQPVDIVYTDDPQLRTRVGFMALTGRPTSGPKAGPSVRIALLTPQGVHVTGQDLDIWVKQTLTVFLAPNATFLVGGVEATSGFVDLFDRRWNLENAVIPFDRSTPPNPRLNLTVSHEFTTTTVYVTITGTLRDPKLQLGADPGAYDQATILSWVLGGSPDDNSTDHPPISQAAVGVASNLLLGSLQSSIRDALPFDVVKLQVGEGADTQTTRLQVGKWLTDSLFLGYRARFNSSDETKNVNEANAEWRFARRWILDAFYGDRGSGGADVVWSKKILGYRARMAEYHEPESELSDQVRDLHRALTSLKEEIEAIDWYHQRWAASKDESLRAVLAHNRDEEIEHAVMNLEWIRRNMPHWDEVLRTYLFTEDTITSIEKGAKGESAAGGGDLGVGSLKGDK